MKTTAMIQEALKRLADPDLLKAPRHLTGQDPWPDVFHCFDAVSLAALRSAVAAQRPLLIRGEPGIGKSQIARAAADVLGAKFLPFVVNSTCESGDLLAAADPVARLVQAQILGAGVETNQAPAKITCAEAETDQAEGWEARLDENRFLTPRPLWWALNWGSAKAHDAQCFRPVREPHPQLENWAASSGCVVLIDEIDKADSDFPNGLLESLGNSGFQLLQGSKTIVRDPEQAPPLIVVTTNEDRELPAAFLRRCLVLHLAFPEDDSEALTFLSQRARAHFPKTEFPTKVLRAAGKQLLEDRAATQAGQPKPGAAEYLDLLRALQNLAPDDWTSQTRLLREIGRYFLRKESR
jgi:MoxR-like ATPase